MEVRQHLPFFVLQHLKYSEHNIVCVKQDGEIEELGDAGNRSAFKY